MPILTKIYHVAILQELHVRFKVLEEALRGRPLVNHYEGLKSARWKDPDLVCGTVGSKMQIALALGDFQNILKQIGTLK